MKTYWLLKRIFLFLLLILSTGYLHAVDDTNEGLPLTKENIPKQSIGNRIKKIIKNAEAKTKKALKAAGAGVSKTIKKAIAPRSVKPPPKRQETLVAAPTTTKQDSLKKSPSARDIPSSTTQTRAEREATDAEKKAEAAKREADKAKEATQKAMKALTAEKTAEREATDAEKKAEAAEKVKKAEAKLQAQIRETRKKIAEEKEAREAATAKRAAATAAATPNADTPSRTTSLNRNNSNLSTSATGLNRSSSQQSVNRSDSSVSADARGLSDPKTPPPKLDRSPPVGPVGLPKINTGQDQKAIARAPQTEIKEGSAQISPMAESVSKQPFAIAVEAKRKAGQAEAAPNAHTPSQATNLNRKDSKLSTGSTSSSRASSSLLSFDSARSQVGTTDSETPRGPQAAAPLPTEAEKETTKALKTQKKGGYERMPSMGEDENLHATQADARNNSPTEDKPSVAPPPAGLEKINTGQTANQPTGTGTIPPNSTPSVTPIAPQNTPTSSAEVPKKPSSLLQKAWKSVFGSPQKKSDSEDSETKRLLQPDSPTAPTAPAAAAQPQKPVTASLTVREDQTVKVNLTIAEPPQAEAQQKQKTSLFQRAKNAFTSLFGSSAPAAAEAKAQKAPATGEQERSTSLVRTNSSSSRSSTDLSRSSSTLSNLSDTDSDLSRSSKNLSRSSSTLSNLSNTDSDLSRSSKNLSRSSSTLSNLSDASSDIEEKKRTTFHLDDMRGNDKKEFKEILAYYKNQQEGSKKLTEEQIKRYYEDKYIVKPNTFEGKKIIAQIEAKKAFMKKTATQSEFNKTVVKNILSKIENHVPHNRNNEALMKERERIIQERAEKSLFYQIKEKKLNADPSKKNFDKLKATYQKELYGMTRDTIATKIRNIEKYNTLPINKPLNKEEQDEKEKIEKTIEILDKEREKIKHDTKELPPKERKKIEDYEATKLNEIKNFEKAMQAHKGDLEKKKAELDKTEEQEANIKKQEVETKAKIEAANKERSENYDKSHFYEKESKKFPKGIEDEKQLDAFNKRKETYKKNLAEKITDKLKETEALMHQYYNAKKDKKEDLLKKILDERKKLEKLNFDAKNLDLSPAEKEEIQKLDQKSEKVYNKASILPRQLLLDDHFKTIRPKIQDNYDEIEKATKNPEKTALLKSEIAEYNKALQTKLTELDAKTGSLTQAQKEALDDWKQKKGYEALEHKTNAVLGGSTHAAMMTQTSGQHAMIPMGPASQAMMAAQGHPEASTSPAAAASDNDNKKTSTEKPDATPDPHAGLRRPNLAASSSAEMPARGGGILGGIGSMFGFGGGGQGCEVSERINQSNENPSTVRASPTGTTLGTLEADAEEVEAGSNKAKNALAKGATHGSFRNPSCGVTQGLNTVSIAGLAGSMLTGGSIVQNSGQSKAAIAGSSETQESAYRLAAETQKDAASVQMALGSASAALGAYQLYRGYQHSQAEKEFHAAAAKVDTSLHVVEKGDNTVEDISGKNLYKGTTVQGSLHTEDAQVIQISQAYSSDNRYELPKVVPDVLVPEGAPPAAVPGTEEYRLKYAKERAEEVQQSLKNRANQAAAEQGSAAGTAAMGGGLALLVAAPQITNAALGLKEAARLDKMADDIRAARIAKENSASKTSLGANVGTGMQLNNGGSYNTASLKPLVNDAGKDVSGQDSASAATGSSNDFGNGFNTPSNTPPATPPLASNNNPAAAPPRTPTAAGSGGGGGNVSTSPISPEADSPGVQSAGGGALGYESSSGGKDHLGGGGGGFMSSGGGASGSGAPDFNGLLAKFLPNNENTQRSPAGILNYGQKNSERELGSLLDRNVNIFDRITDAYSRYAKNTLSTEPPR